LLEFTLQFVTVEKSNKGRDVVTQNIQIDPHDENIIKQLDSELNINLLQRPLTEFLEFSDQYNHAYSLDSAGRVDALKIHSSNVQTKHLSSLIGNLTSLQRLALRDNQIRKIEGV